MFGWYIDPVYFWYVLIPTLLISIGVQVYLRSTFSKWSNVKNSTGQAGVQVVKQLFDRTSLQPIRVERISGTMLSLIHISEPTRPRRQSRMPSSA